MSVAEATGQILIVAGEASGDLHAANLVSAFRKHDPNVRFFGVGGKEMAHAGVDVAFDSADVAVMGLAEVVRHAPRILRVLRWIKSAIRVMKPRAIVLVDFPDFNFRVAAAARGTGVPVFYYISPQVWAWRRGRVKFLAEHVAKMAVIFPFEVPFYKEAGVPVTFVGHPLLDGVQTVTDPEETRRKLGVPVGQPLVVLMPGSRRSEIDYNLPNMARAAALIRARIPKAHFAIPVASTLRVEEVATAWRDAARADGGVPASIERVPSLELLRAADVAAVCSGTATLETAIAGTPAVVVYRMNPISFEVGRRLVHVPHIGLVNLVAGARIAPELIQNDFTPTRLAHELLAFLESPERLRETRTALLLVRDKLGGPGASSRAAQALSEMLLERSPTLHRGAA